jgi:parallel beta-helix repeat protein
MTTPIVPNGHLVLQAIVDDAAAKNLSSVELPSGIFLMRAPLYLRSNLTIKGNNTTLRKQPSVRSKILDHLGYGLYEFRVAEPHLFEIGMAAHLVDNRAVGFYTTVARIVDRVGDAFILDTPCRHDYSPGEEGFAVNAHSLIEAGWITDAQITNVTLDGNIDNEPFRINGCRAAGVFLIGCDRVRLANLQVHHFHGDGISFQQCTDIRVENNHIHHNAGGGLHPGSGSVRYWCLNNNIHHNGADGFFYCLRTTHSIVVGNTISDNQGVGISIGERDTDHHIENNTISGNNAGGVVFRNIVKSGGNRVTLKHNRITHQNGPAILVPEEITDIWIESNFIESSGPALQVKPNAGRVAFLDNTVAGKPQAASDISGTAFTDRGQALAGQPWPKVGTDPVIRDHIRHLGRQIQGL